MPRRGGATEVTSPCRRPGIAMRHASHCAGDLLDFTAAPDWADTGLHGVRFRSDHWLLVEDGRIVGSQPGVQVPDAAWACQDHRGRLILPGFIDTHVHSAQLDVIASYGAELLTWLNTYTFPAELRHADPAYAEAGAAHFLAALLAHGTTSAAVFPTVHKVSVDALFAAATAARHAPRRRQGADGSQCACRTVRRRCAGRARLCRPDRTLAWPRPPGLCGDGALRADEHAAAVDDGGAALRGLADRLHADARGREPRRSALGARAFPDARSYLDVYARAGLLHARSVLAHGIWLDDEDRAALRASGAQIAHSPSSNLFLGSGLFGWRALHEAGVAVSLASDVGGGTSLSMLRAMADAYKVQALAGQRLTAWKALHAATRGAARALGLAHEIGSLDVGCMADVCVWDWAVGLAVTRRMERARELHERAFAWMTLADERNLAAAFVGGVERFARTSAMGDRA